MALRDILKGMNATEAPTDAMVASVLPGNLNPPVSPGRRVGGLVAVDDPTRNVYVAPISREGTFGYEPGIVDLNVFAQTQPGLGYAPPEQTRMKSVDLAQLALSDPTLVQDLLFQATQPNQFPALPQMSEGFDAQGMVATAEGYRPNLEQMSAVDLAEWIQSEYLPEVTIAQTEQGTPFDWPAMVKATEWVPTTGATAYQTAMVQQETIRLWNDYHMLIEQAGTLERETVGDINTFCPMTQGGMGGDPNYDYQTCVDQLMASETPLAQKERERIELQGKLGTTATQLLNMGANPDDFARDQTLLSKFFGYAGDAFDKTWGKFQFNVTNREAIGEAWYAWAQGEEGKYDDGWWNFGQDFDLWAVGGVAAASFDISWDEPIPDPETGEMTGHISQQYTKFDPNNPDHVTLRNSIMYIYENGYAPTGHNGKRAIFDFINDLTVTGLRQLTSDILQDPSNVAAGFAGAGKGLIKTAIAPGFRAATKVDKASRIVKFGTGAAIVALDEGQVFFVNRSMGVGGYLAAQGLGAINKTVPKIGLEKVLGNTRKAFIEKNANRTVNAAKLNAVSNNLAVVADDGTPITINQGHLRAGATLNTKVIHSEAGIYMGPTGHTAYLVDDANMQPPDLSAGVPAAGRGRNGEPITYFTQKSVPFTPASGSTLDNPDIHQIQSGNTQLVRNNEGGWNAYVWYQPIVGDATPIMEPHIVGKYTNEQAASAIGIKAPLYTTVDPQGDNIIRFGGISQDPAFPEDMVVSVRLNNGKVVPNLPLAGNVDDVDMVHVTFVNDSGVVSRMSTVQYRGVVETLPNGTVVDTGHKGWKTTTVNGKAFPNLGDNSRTVSSPDAEFTIVRSDAADAPDFSDTQFTAAVGTVRNGDQFAVGTATRQHGQWQGEGASLKAGQSMPPDEFLVITVNGQPVPIRFYSEQAADDYVLKLKQGKTWSEALPNVQKLVTRSEVDSNVHETLAEAVSYLMYKHKQAGFHPYTRSAQVITPAALPVQAVPTPGVVDEVVEAGQPLSDSALAAQTRRMRVEELLAQQQETRLARETERQAQIESGIPEPEAPAPETELEDWEIDLYDRQNRNNAADEGFNEDPDEELRNVEPDPEDFINTADRDPDLQDKGRQLHPDNSGRTVQSYYDRRSDTHVYIDELGNMSFVDRMLLEIASFDDPLSKMSLADVRTAREMSTIRNYSDAVGIHYPGLQPDLAVVPEGMTYGQRTFTRATAGSMHDYLVNLANENLENGLTAKHAMREMVDSIAPVDGAFLFHNGTEMRIMQPIGVRRTENSWVFGIVDAGPLGDEPAEMALLRVQDEVRESLYRTKSDVVGTMPDGQELRQSTDFKTFIDRITNPDSETSFLMEGNEVLPVSMVGTAAEAWDRRVILGHHKDMNHHRMELVVLDTSNGRVYVSEGPVIENVEHLQQSLRNYDAVTRNNNAGYEPQRTTYFGWNMAHDAIDVIARYMADLTKDMVEGPLSPVAGGVINTIRDLSNSAMAIRKVSSHLADIDSYASTQLSDSFFETLFNGIVDPRNDPYQILRAGASTEDLFNRRTIFWNVAVGTYEGQLFERIVQNLPGDRALHRFQAMGVPESLILDAFSTVWKAVNDPAFEAADLTGMRYLLAKYAHPDAKVVDNAFPKTIFEEFYLPLAPQMMVHKGLLSEKAGVNVLQSVEVLNQRIMRTFEVAQLMRTRKLLRNYVNQLADTFKLSRDEVRDIGLMSVDEIMAIPDPMVRSGYDIIRRIELGVIELERTATLVDFGHRNYQTLIKPFDERLRMVKAHEERLYREQQDLLTDSRKAEYRSAELMEHLNRNPEMSAALQQGVLDLLLDPFNRRLAARRSKNPLMGRATAIAASRHPADQIAPEMITEAVSKTLQGAFGVEKSVADDVAGLMMEGGRDNAVIRELQVPVVTELLQRLEKMEAGSDVFTKFFSESPDDILTALYAVPEARVQMALIAQMVGPGYEGQLDFIFEHMESVGARLESREFRALLAHLWANQGFMDVDSLTRAEARAALTYGEAKMRRMGSARKNGLRTLNLQHDKTSRYEIGGTLYRAGTPAGEQVDEIPAAITVRPDPDNEGQFLDIKANDFHQLINDDEITAEVRLLMVNSDGSIAFPGANKYMENPYRSFDMYTERADEVIENQPVNGVEVTHDGYIWNVGGAMPVIYPHKTTGYATDYLVVLVRTERVGGVDRMVKRVEMWKGILDSQGRNIRSNLYRMNRIHNDAAGERHTILRELFADIEVGRAHVANITPGRPFTDPATAARIGVYDPDEINIVGLVQPKFPERTQAGIDRPIIDIDTRRTADVKIGSGKDTFKRTNDDIVIQGTKPEGARALSRELEQAHRTTPRLGLMENMVVRVNKRENGVYAELYSPVPWQDIQPLRPQLAPVKQNGYYHIASIHIADEIDGTSISVADLTKVINREIGQATQRLAISDGVRAADSLDVLEDIMGRNPALSPNTVPPGQLDPLPAVDEQADRIAQDRNAIDSEKRCPE